MNVQKYKYHNNSFSKYYTIDNILSNIWGLVGKSIMEIYTFLVTISNRWLFCAFLSLYRFGFIIEKMSRETKK